MKECNIASELRENAAKIIERLWSQDETALIHYDLKQDCAAKIYKSAEKFINPQIDSASIDDVEALKLYKGLSPFSRLARYRLADGVYDCDASLFANIVYALAFPFTLENGRLIGKSNGENYRIYSTDSVIYEFCGDTLNSWATTMHAYFVYKSVTDASFKKEMEALITPDGVKVVEKIDSQRVWFTEEFYNCSLRKPTDKYGNPWELVAITFPGQLENTLLNGHNIFLDMVHTLGNFMPVPFSTGKGAFNSPRGIGYSRDYWDCAINCIKVYYEKCYSFEECDETEVFSLKWLIYPNKYNKKSVEIRNKKARDNFTLCAEWLNSFDSFEDFARRNHLGDYTDDLNPRFDKNNKIMCLWGDSFEQRIKNCEAVLPRNEEDFLNFFEAAADANIQRGKRVVRAVKKRLAELLANKTIYEIARGLIFRRKIKNG